ncbi:hypothetical protein HPP92_027770 [Vanilla planifolia]|uniref:Uncharacterized protein n=1 Tax=Vanilla planifolia TaxID=51239 RepID=A0A835U501_VANPL|nr:hypothetical protein HPP92_027770 [Vanilla planifolia]
MSQRQRKELRSRDDEALLESMGSAVAIGPEAHVATEKSAFLITARAGAGDPSTIPSICRISSSLQYHSEAKAKSLLFKVEMVLAMLQHSWRKVSVINIMILIVLVVVYAFACGLGTSSGWTMWGYVVITSPNGILDHEEAMSSCVVLMALSRKLIKLWEVLAQNFPVT